MRPIYYGPWSMVPACHGSLVWCALFLVSAAADDACVAGEGVCPVDVSPAQCDEKTGLPLLDRAATASPCGRVCGTASKLDCLFTELTGDASGHSAALGLGKEYTYGELKPGSFATLLNGLGLMGIKADGADAFVDLGSGLGKLPLQAFLHGLKSSRGTELEETRYYQSTRITEKLGMLLQLDSFRNSSQARMVELRSGDSHVQLGQGDLLKADIHDATIVFAASLCFPHALHTALAGHLRSLQPGAVQCCFH
eukprot:TRINITY_DN34600_c0_g1_i3.p1 TRINITY_DN34600_c0_g1~~TRINITY_DN34600_c0_g1_i3.p1  ORF type:complete len:253 (+),score=29.02 TRINITY_DN34600_c0_g1_i3:169-927(+)